MKTWKITAVVAGLLVLAGCGNKTADNPTAPVKSTQTEAQSDVQKKEKGNGLISSIKDAMGLGKEMKCTYKIKIGEGEMESVAYISGSKYMTEVTVAGNTQRMIFDEGTMYSWSVGQKQGTKIAEDCAKGLATPQNTAGNAPEASDQDGPDPFSNALDVKCEENSGADFSIPTDVTFVDQCEMMKNITKGVPTAIPDVPAGISQEIPANIPQAQQ